MDQIGRNARAAVEQYYSKKAIEEKLNEILEAVTREKSGGESRKR
jgi:glycosyltransferase involved in cell wall biosynthesis